jgi:hypothetical protein
LSSQWLDDAAEAIAADAGVQALRLGNLVLQVETSGIVYHVRISPDGVVLVGAAHPDPDVCLQQSRSVAEAVATGAASAQEVFVSGQVRLVGSADHLLTARPVLEAIEVALRPVRAATSY